MSPLRPNASSGTTPARASAKTSSGKARKTSIVRLMMRVDDAAEEAGDDAEDRADDHGEQRREEGDEQGDLGAVDDAAEDVAAVDRLEPEEEVPGHAAVRADRDLGVGVDELLVELVRRVAEQADDERGGDRDDDEVDDEEAAGERDLVALEPRSRRSGRASAPRCASRPAGRTRAAPRSRRARAQGECSWMPSPPGRDRCRRPGRPSNMLGSSRNLPPPRPRGPIIQRHDTVSNRLGRIVTRWRSSGDLPRGTGRSPAPEVPPSRRSGAHRQRGTARLGWPWLRVRLVVEPTEDALEQVLHRHEADRAGGRRRRGRAGRAGPASPTRRRAGRARRRRGPPAS